LRRSDDSLFDLEENCTRDDETRHMILSIFNKTNIRSDGLSILPLPKFMEEIVRI
jgi:hypothetical protein